MATIRDGNTTALVVIDVQNDVMAHAWERDAVVRRIATLLSHARAERIPVIHVQHQDDEMPQGTDGWQFVEDVAPVDGEPVVAKRYLDAFAETELPRLLAETGASHLVIAGAQSMACIRATSHRALAEGYDLTLVSDAHTTDDLDWGEVSLTAQQIVDYTNLFIQFTAYPGQQTQVVPHHEVSFPTPAGMQEIL